MDDYYRRGLKINRRLGRDDQARRYGLHAKIVIDDESRNIRMKLLANAGFEYPARIALNLMHSTRSGFDKAIILRRVGTRRYIGDLPPLPVGRWNLQIEASDWRLSDSLWVR